MSVADWLAIDKAAVRDIRDGLRFLHGRKPKAQNKETTQAQVNAMAVDDSDSDSWETDGDTESVIMDSDVSDWDYDTDDTEDDHVYDLDALKTSRPMRAPVVINGECVQAVFDTGASISVISKSLADKLKLKTTGDTLQLSSLGRDAGSPSQVTANVPICVAGKYRPDHMCILDTDRTVCLLGMTWFKTHGIRLDHSDGTIPIRTRHGRDYSMWSYMLKNIWMQVAKTRMLVMSCWLYRLLVMMKNLKDKRLNNH